MTIDRARQETACRRLNVGSGECPLLYWTNCDPDTRYPADLRVSVPPLPYEDGALDEIYAGHFLEHLTQDKAKEFLRECFRCLVPGGKIGIVVPDTREILTRYLAGAIDAVEFPRGTWNRIDNLDDVCKLFLYSTAQQSPHLWSYNEDTLIKALEGAGFVIMSAIDRYTDPRLGTGQWYQMGFDAIKPFPKENV